MSTLEGKQTVFIDFYSESCKRYGQEFCSKLAVIRFEGRLVDCGVIRWGAVHWSLCSCEVRLNSAPSLVCRLTGGRFSLHASIRVCIAGFITGGRFTSSKPYSVCKKWLDVFQTTFSQRYNSLLVTHYPSTSTYKPSSRNYNYFYFVKSDSFSLGQRTKKTA